MVVTNKWLLLFVLYVIVPSILSYFFLPSHLFLIALFVIVLIWSLITYYYSTKQEVDTLEFDNLINSKVNFDDFIDSIKWNKYASLIKEYKNNKNFIIENNTEIIIYPIENTFNILNIFKTIKFLNLPSFKYKRPILKINLDWIEYRWKKNIKWENLTKIKLHSLNNTQSWEIKYLKLESHSGNIDIPFQYTWMPLRRENLKTKIEKFMKKNKINQ